MGYNSPSKKNSPCHVGRKGNGKGFCEKKKWGERKKNKRKTYAS
jgi:hypothetical protein